MKCFFVVCVLFLLIGELSLLTQGKVFTRCGLTEELIRRNFPRTFVGNWVCLIESESGKDTSKVTNKPDGSKNLGIFQINSKGWCTYNKSGGWCNMKCEDLLNENLMDDSACAKLVHNSLGFQGWNGWVRNCYRRPQTLPKC
ncbi:hypothetical protein ILUMI_27020 [Ignelater luminosus]|uniref:lysozyme n=1 Tax=Ignelater luminosus TaxID=2038154 RepID=A0A8K0FX44_IGNLU|nr:hypothetical protein ILUMI_27020 [Ignelater luminosus]